MPFNLKIYSNFNTFDYEKYFQPGKYLMNNPIWMKEWWAVFKNVENNKIGKKKKLCIIVAQKDKEYLVFPLVLLTRSIKGINIRFLEILSQQWGGCETEIIYSSNNAKKLIPITLKFIKNKIKYDICFLKYLPENSCLNNNQSLLIHAIVPFIKINNYSDFQNYKNSIYSKKLKHKYRAANNKARKNNIKIKILKQEINENIFKSIKKISQSKILDGKHSIYNDSNKSKFYFNVFKKLKSNVILIKLNNYIVAYRINIIYNNKKYCIDASYDRTYKQYDLGAISVDSNISDSFHYNLNIHSMGPGADLYKFRYNDNIKFLYSFLKKGNSLKSIFIFPIFKFFLKKRHKNIKLKIANEKY